MIDYLVIVIVVAALSQVVSKRRYPACVFAAVTFSHWMWLSGLEGFYYCLSAGVCDVLVIYLICSYSQTSRLADTLIFISLMSIVLNLYGWLLWYYYLPVESYNTSIAALYLIAIISLLWKERAHDNNRDVKWYSRIPLSFG